MRPSSSSDEADGARAATPLSLRHGLQFTEASPPRQGS